MNGQDGEETATCEEEENWQTGFIEVIACLSEDIDSTLSGANERG